LCPKSDYDYRGLDRLAGVFVPLEFPPGEWRGASEEEFDPVSSLGRLAEVTVVSAVDGGRGEGDTHLPNPAVHFAGDFALRAGPDQQGIHLFPSQ
jgi:hypothetical protein